MDFVDLLSIPDYRARVYDEPNSYFDGVSHEVCLVTGFPLRRACK